MRCNIFDARISDSRSFRLDLFPIRLLSVFVGITNWINAVGSDNLVDKRIFKIWKNSTSGSNSGFAPTINRIHVEVQHPEIEERTSGGRKNMDSDRRNGITSEGLDTDYEYSDLSEHRRFISSFDAKNNSSSSSSSSSSSNNISSSNSSLSRRLPQAIIIGVKKGGTRALLEFLKIHPDVRAMGPESHFFDKNFHRGLDWYRNQMPPSTEDQITIEKTPSYFITRGVPERIRSMSKDVRLIVVVRDPVTRAISDYTQAISKRPDLGSFEQLAFVDNASRMVDPTWGPIKIGMYCRHLERWLDHFPRKQIHFVNGERLVSDPSNEMAKLERFLDLKPVISTQHFIHNSTKGFPCVLSPGSELPKCLGKTKGRTHPSVNPDAFRRLAQFFRPFNVKFYQMTGINFNWLTH